MMQQSTSPKKICIIVADDHPIVREGLVAILSTQPDFDIVSEADNGKVLVEKARRYQPDVILTDLEMPQGDGISAIEAIHAQFPQTGIIVFTAFNTDDRILGAIQAGAKGYLMKGAPREDIFRAIRTVAAGEALLEPEITTQLLAQLSGNTQTQQTQSELVEALTPREMEVLAYLGRGMTNKDIGAELFITERTVKFYVSAIMGKLSANNRTEAVSIAIQRGLLTL